MRQKTIWHDDVEVLDEMVNAFESRNKIYATQSYFAAGNHFRVLFFMEGK